MRIRRLGAITLVVGLLGACGQASVGSSPPAASPSDGGIAATSAAPTASQTPIPASPSPGAPSPTPVAGSTLAWHRVGATSGGDVVGFGGGYVALGGKTGVESSTDGQSWTAVHLPFHATKDPHGIALEATPLAIATDGHRVVIVGGYGHVPCQPSDGAVGGGPECPSSPISWSSTDGRTWTSSFPWRGPGAPKGYYQGNQFITVWAVPTGGFDASSWYVSGEAGAAGPIYHSMDGLAWSVLTSPPTALAGSPNPPEFWRLGLADATGRRLVGGYWYLANGDSVVRLFSSLDGRAWTTIDSFPGSNVNADSGLAPLPDLAPIWILAGQDATRLPTIWTSPDLLTWTAHNLPTAPDAEGSVSAVAATRLGYVAVASLSNGPDGAAYHSSWVSSNGLDWTQLATPGSAGDDGPDVLADGPAGVVGFAVYNGEQVPPDTWLLK